MTVAVEQFVESVTDALDECGAGDDTLASVETAGEQLVKEVEQLHDELTETRDELESVRDRAGRDRAELSSRVTELEESVEESHDSSEEPDSPGSNPRGKTGQHGEGGPTETVPSPQTALEDTIRLPETVASDSLTANEQRARSVARDLGNYCDYNHQYGTYSLTASTLRKVLTAQSDGDGSVHAQTVKRVRQFLTRLGEDSVSVVEDTGGTRRITFAESLVDRIESWVEAHDGVTAETQGMGLGT